MPCGKPAENHFIDASPSPHPTPRSGVGCGEGGDRPKPDGGTPALRQTAIKPHLRLAPPRRRRLQKPTAGRRLCARRSAAAAPFSTYSAVSSFLVSLDRFIHTCFASRFRANTPQHGVPSAARKALSPQSTPTAAARRWGYREKQHRKSGRNTEQKTKSQNRNVYSRLTLCKNAFVFRQDIPCSLPTKTPLSFTNVLFTAKALLLRMQMPRRGVGRSEQAGNITAAFLFACK